MGRWRGTARTGGRQRLDSVEERCFIDVTWCDAMDARINRDGYCFDDRKEPSGMLLKHGKGSLQEVQPQFRVRTSIIRSAHTPQSRSRILPPRGQVRPCGAEPMLYPGGPCAVALVHRMTQAPETNSAIIDCQSASPHAQTETAEALAGRQQPQSLASGSMWSKLRSTGTCTDARRLRIRPRQHVPARSLSLRTDAQRSSSLSW